MTVRRMLFPLLLATLAFAFEALAEMTEAMPDERAPPSAITLVKARCIFCYGPTLSWVLVEECLMRAIKILRAHSWLSTTFLMPQPARRSWISLLLRWGLPEASLIKGLAE
jgi:hypothetical protein